MVLAEVVLEGGYDDGREIALHRGCRLLKAGRVVIVVIDQMGAILFGDAGHRWRAPRNRTVIGAARHQHLAPSGSGPRDRHAGRGGVRAVLREHRPVGMRDRIDHEFREFDQPRCRAVEPVALRPLPRRGFLDIGIAIAEDHRPPGAHIVDITATIRVPDAAALAARKILRIADRHTGGILVSPHPAGDDFGRARPECRIDRLLIHVSCPHRIAHKFDISCISLWQAFAVMTRPRCWTCQNPQW